MSQQRLGEEAEKYKWRPIAEVHEDYGSIILMDIDDPGRLVLSHACSLNWEEDSAGMTHFAIVPMLGQEQYEALRTAHEAATKKKYQA